MVCLVQTCMRHIRAAHEVPLYTPQAASLQSILPLHADGVHIGHQGIGHHIHAFPCTRNICFHHRITLMDKIFLGKCILVCIGIRIDNKVLVSGSGVRSCPEEIFALLCGSQFTRYPNITIEHALHFSSYIIAVLVFQHGNLPIHLRMGKEVYDHLFVLLYKLFKRSFVRCLNIQDGLRSGIYIFRILEFRLCIEIFVYIDNNDIADQLQRCIIISGRRVHYTE